MKNTYWLIGLLAVAGPALSQGLPCPIDEAHAQITRIDPPDAQVSILRGSQVLTASASPRPCVLFGDRVDAGNAMVEIDSPKGVLTIGRYQDSRFYYAPKRPARSERGMIDSVKLAFERLRDDPQRPRAGAGRSGLACGPAEEGAPRPLRALKRLPEGEQRVGDDLGVVVVAWSRQLGRNEVLLKVTDPMGSVVFEKAVCGSGPFAIDIPPPLRAGHTTLKVTVTKPGQATLAWTIRIVDATTLPVPGGVERTDWALGAWRVESGGPDVRIDALSRLHAASDTYLAAYWATTAVLTDGF